MVECDTFYCRIILKRKPQDINYFKCASKYGKYVKSCMINSGIQAKVGEDLHSTKKRVLSLITSCHICPLKILAKRFV